MAENGKMEWTRWEVIILVSPESLIENLLSLLIPNLILEATWIAGKAERTKAEKIAYHNSEKTVQNVDI